MNPVIVWAPGTTLEELERLAILSSLLLYGGSRTDAAKSLGVPLRTLRHKLRLYKNQGFTVPKAPDPKITGAKRRGKVRV
jgi:DNA-binding NtrC family response regulator